MQFNYNSFFYLLLYLLKFYFDPYSIFFFFTFIIFEGVGTTRVGSCGLIVESRTHNRKVASSSLVPAGIVGGGSEGPALSSPSIPRRGALEQGTKPPTAPRALQHKWLPTALGVCSRCVCVHCCVCALWMGYIQSMKSEYGSPYLAVCHVTFPFFL